MKLGKTILVVWALAGACAASEWDQKYERAYFLETAKGQTEEALKIYREIAATEATDENRAVITKTLRRMLAINEAAEKRGGAPEGQRELYKRGVSSSRRAFALLFGSKKAEYAGEQEALFEAAATIFDQLLEMRLDQGEPGGDHSDRVARSMVLRESMRLAHMEENMARVAEIQAELIRTGVPIPSVISQSFDEKEAVLFLPAGRHVMQARPDPDIGLGWNTGHLTVKGSDRDTCVLEGSFDKAMFNVMQGGTITFDSVTLKSQLASYPVISTPDECAVWVRNGSMTATNCAFVALGNRRRSPRAIYASGFGAFTLRDCEFRGFDRSVVMSDAAEGALVGCAFRDTDCGIDMQEGAVLDVKNCLFAGATSAGILAFGDEVRIADSLFVGNNQGVWSSGNKKIEIVGNAFVNQGENGLDTRTGSGLLVKNNVFSKNKHYGVHGVSMEDARVERNIFTDNGGGVVVIGRADGPPMNNTSWNNTQVGGSRSTSTYRAPAYVQESVVNADPRFKDAKHGDFSIGAEAVKDAGHGLTDPAAIQALWKKNEQLTKDQ